VDTEPKFQPGDRVTSLHGSGKIKDVLRDRIGNFVGAYVLDKGGGSLVSGVMENTLSPRPLLPPVNVDDFETSCTNLGKLKNDEDVVVYCARHFMYHVDPVKQEYRFAQMPTSGGEGGFSRWVKMRFTVPDEKDFLSGIMGTLKP
jgi:hypothetical protein